jgi:hypothetical protein
MLNPRGPMPELYFLAARFFLFLFHVAARAHDFGARTGRPSDNPNFPGRTGIFETKTTPNPARKKFPAAFTKGTHENFRFATSGGMSKNTALAKQNYHVPGRRVSGGFIRHHFELRRGRDK